jgi:alpha-tubulin suppressor-like RCC1 family protein
MGSNADGKLGINNHKLKQCNVPTLVEGIFNVTQVSCGMSHTLAVTENGEAYSWGQSFYGALGLSPKTNSNQNVENQHSPVQITAFKGEFVEIVEAGSRHSVFVTQSNKVFVCGDANQGQLGLGTRLQDRVMIPTEIEVCRGTKVKQVCCGKFHTLILTESGEIWACGANNFGQIGNNST